MKQKNILVAGAGIVGISSAIWLQRAGHKVTVVDRKGPASGTSYGNAGVLAAGAIVPVTIPSLITKAPLMLFDKDSPLFLKWFYLPKLVSFLPKYMSFATNAHVDYYSQAMSTLLLDSAAQHRALALGTAAERFIYEDDYCFGYATKASFEADKYSWQKRDAVGVRYEVICGRKYADFDPIFGDAFETVVRCKDHGRISDPGAYVQALSDHFVEQGGELLITSINDIQIKGGLISGLETDHGVLSADAIVFALGPWSKKIAHKLGVKVPLESERGYHIELVNPSEMPRAPMMVAKSKFVITPMEGRIRAAGVIEFGGLTSAVSKAPFELLKRQLASLLPRVTYKRLDEWMGHRPAPADSLPIIGENDKQGRSYSAFGHQHVGLTGGPKTGRLIAEMISGKKPNIDLTPFHPSKHQTR
ncbi:MAG TPA: FAD-dependent oxidoreductase [Rhodobacteraceae bacterium]|jgi:D-amino-acid dehydrogenase|nr:FAD-binding oxidoreductase [Tateyamaria sp.]MCH9748619.1 FAD-binding oxidoreductase [Alphaproteobacteria bacterium]MCH9833389.1 FAD-binding oxidoreductase [Alphaproteobacteria bacterium]HAB39605.1 FAD-dependent oxidoreductase [Paracoccaceae bacterium]